MIATPRFYALFALCALLALSLLHAMPSSSHTPHKAQSHNKPPKWVESKLCEEQNCAIGIASKKEGETHAIARALQELRFSLGASVQAEYTQSQNTQGKQNASQKVRIYAQARNIGYTILDRYEDTKSVYFKIQYDPRKKLSSDEPLPEFRELETLEQLCDDSKLQGYYCTHLGQKYQQGELELAKNDKLALQYYKKACLMGTLEGCVLAGDLVLESHLNTAQENVHATKFEPPTAQSDTFIISQAMRKQAQWYFSQACENGYGTACSKQAHIEESSNKKLALYTQGCKLQDATACAYLGEVYALGLANLAINPHKAHALYKQSAQINPYGDGATLLALESTTQAQKQSPSITKPTLATLTTLCEHNNARACAELGGYTNNQALLQKSTMLRSPQGYYLLSRHAQSPTLKQTLLQASCELGQMGDFTKGCEALGDLLMPSHLLNTSSTQTPQNQHTNQANHKNAQKDKEEALRYYQASCNHLFYEQSACKKLYAIEPKLCKNTLCLTFANELDSSLSSSLESNSTRARQLSLQVDSIIDDSSSEVVKSAAQDSTLPTTAQSTIAESTIAKSHSPSSRIAQSFSSLLHREPKRVRIIGELALGTHSISFPQIRRLYGVVDREAGFLWDSKIGLEISTAKPKLSFYVSPFIKISQAQLFEAKYFSKNDDDEESNVAATMFGSGLHLGVQYKLWRVFAIADYSMNFSRLSHNVSVPLQSMSGLGLGFSCELAFVRVGVQYIHNFYSYYTGDVYRERKLSHLVLDSTQANSHASAVQVIIGVAF